MLAGENEVNVSKVDQSKSDKSDILLELKEQRDVVIEKLSRFINFIKRANESDLLELESRLDHVSSIFNHFEQVQSRIESLEKCTTNSEYRETFENSFFKAQASAKNKIVEFHSNIQARITASHNVASQNNLFNNSVTALVDQNQQLSQVEKLYYLQGRLRGEAEKLIQQLELTDENYLVALRILRERFENKKIIIDKHVEELFNMPVITKESPPFLRNLIDTFKQLITSLKALGEPTDSWDRLLNQLLKIKLDARTRERWHEHLHLQNKREPPPLSEFLDFLVNRCEYLESKEKTDNQQTIGDHRSDSCTRGTCKVCQKKHNTLIHRDNIQHHDTQNQLAKHDNIQTQNHSNPSLATNTHLAIENKQNTAAPRETIQLSSITHHLNNKKQNVLLSTAAVFLKDKSGNLTKARALLDSGSQSNLITSDLARLLNIGTTKINLPVIGVNQATTNITEQLNIDIISRENNSFQQNATFLVINQIAGNIPNFKIDCQHLNIPKHITLADPEFDKSAKLDILLGAGVFWDILADGQFKLGDGKPILQKTLFGWVISGPIYQNCSIQNNSSITISCNLITTMLENAIEKFWKIEEYQDDNKTKRTIEEKQCEEHFLKTIQRTETGRFRATLPVREGVGDLGNSKMNAIKRFHKLESKLINDTVIRQQYSEFMREYDKLGHMTKVPTWATEVDGKGVFYLPHHGVVKDRQPLNYEWWCIRQNRKRYFIE
ncbi:uncharacterized protein LOC130451990 [Diorhabda sublineata]|uniref:uncharacterized protein LOC130451990 n=1 Tax=Diorhabda sublineata TaxID=1163346 RepID=UPI0024E05C28|nr:uncharacterized protein LOC130451990 [Diorhabda sublineata]